SRERTAFGVSRIDGRHDQRYPQVGYDREEAMLVLDLSTGDSLLVPVHDDLGELHLVDTPAGDVAAIHLLFAPWRVWSPSPGGGYAAAWGGTYEIAEIGLAGDTLRVIRRDVPPRRITPAAWSLARQQVVLELRPYNRKRGRHGHAVATAPTAARGVDLLQGRPPALSQANPY